MRVGMGVHRYRIPAVRAEVIACAFGPRRTIGSAMPLGFRRQCFSLPVRIGVRLLPCHPDGPVERERQKAEHAAPHPRAAFEYPKGRWCGTFTNEFEILAIGDLVF